MPVIMHTLMKWKHYLLGINFIIQTDNSNLQHLLQQKMLTTKQHKWIEKISTFDMEILNKKGKDNIVVNALSSKDKEM